MSAETTVPSCCGLSLVKNETVCDLFLKISVLDMGLRTTDSLGKLH